MKNQSKSGIKKSSSVKKPSVASNGMNRNSSSSRRGGKFTDTDQGTLEENVEEQAP